MAMWHGWEWGEGCIMIDIGSGVGGMGEKVRGGI